MADELEVMRGEPMSVKLCGEMVAVKKLTVSKQLDLIDLWTGLSGSDSEAEKGMRETTGFMIKVISFVTDVSAERLDAESTIEEIAEVFGVLYKRELLPLLEGAKKFTKVLNPTE